MHVVEIFLPLRRSDGSRIEESRFVDLQHALTRQFGGVTAFTRAPAEGLWKDDNAEVVADEIVVFEVMADVIDAPFWRALRQELEAAFDQKEVIIRTHSIERL